MLKMILFLSTAFQLFISTSIEILGNERGEVVVEPKVEAPVVEPVVEPKKESAPIEPTVDAKKEKNDLLRELSKEYGINLFDAEGIKKFKEYEESQKTDKQKLEEQIATLTNEKQTWQSTIQEYEGKLKARELGIPQDKFEDALKLAGGDPNNLAKVIEKYPTFKSTQAVRIGVSDPNLNQQPNGMSEVERYKAANPHIYGKTKK